MFNKKLKNELWNFMVDTHTYCTHFIIDRSINVSLWTGCLLGKARSEHDVLWTGTWYGFDQSANKKLNFDINYITKYNITLPFRETHDNLISTYLNLGSKFKASIQVSTDYSSRPRINIFYIPNTQWPNLWTSYIFWIFNRYNI